MSKKSTPKSDDKPALNFEAALQELEALVERMERGDLSLEDSLRDFERGVELTRTCQEALKAAEQKVRVLVEQGDKVELAPFEEDQ